MTNTPIPTQIKMKEYTYKVHYKMRYKKEKLGSFFIKGKNQVDAKQKSKIHLSDKMTKEDLAKVVFRVSKTSF